MIDPKELRLENLLWLPGINRFVKVSAIFKTHFRCQDFDGISFDESIRVNYQPVELTPDILEAAGFGVNKDNSFGYINENEGILIELGDFYEDDGRAVFYYNLPDTDNSTCIAYCKYLHQLQNLYYCLTGEELQIDITKLNK